MFEGLFLSDYSGTEGVGAVVTLLVLAALGIAAWRCKKKNAGPAPRCCRQPAGSSAVC